MTPSINTLTEEQWTEIIERADELVREGNPHRVSYSDVAKEFGVASSSISRGLEARGRKLGRNLLFNSNSKQVPIDTKTDEAAIRSMKGLKNKVFNVYEALSALEMDIDPDVKNDLRELIELTVVASNKPVDPLVMKALEKAVNCLEYCAINLNSLKSGSRG